MSRRAILHFCVTLLTLFALLLAAGCTSDDDGDDEPRSAIVRVTPTPVTEGDTGVEAGPTPTPVLEGLTVDQYELEVGWCFNQYEFFSAQLEETNEFTTQIDCGRPHNGEVYATFFHPAGPDTPFPGTSEMERWANIQCHSAFFDFVAKKYEESELFIGTIRPTEETWSAGPHREVTCYVFAEDGALVGSMEGSEF